MWDGERQLRGCCDGFLPKDFIVTKQGWTFAVVAAGTEAGRVLGFLRYAPGSTDDSLRKVSTDQANQLLRDDRPDYLFHSSHCDADLHGVPTEDIDRHFRPTDRVAQIAAEQTRDAIEQTACRVIELLRRPDQPADHWGVTGSVLLDAHNDRSDIDLVVYGRDNYLSARRRLRQAIDDGILSPLDEQHWKDAYARRACDLSFDEYVWHERRKYNKCRFEGTTVDVSGLAEDIRPRDERPSQKIGRRRLQARVVDDQYAFDYPARYLIDHSEIEEVVAFTATYFGQAMTGEMIDAAGWAERSASGCLRLIVGTSREAASEFLRVIRQSRP